MLLRRLHNRGFFHLLTANFLTQAMGFGTSLFVAKFLTPVELGEVKVLQSYTTVFIVLAGLGYNAAVLKRCSETLDDAEYARTLHLALHRALLGSFLALVLVVGLVEAGLLTASAHLARWLPVYAAIIPFTVTTNILIVYLQARNRITEMARAQTVIKLESFVAVVTATWLWGFPGFVFATLVAYVAGLLPVLKEIRPAWLLRPPIASPAGFAKLAHWSLLANGIAIVGLYTDIFMLDHFVEDRSGIGYYTLATIFVLAAMQVTTTVQAIATPEFSHRAGDAAWFRRNLPKQQARLTALSWVVAVVLYLVALVTVPLVYGPRYHSTLVYLPILLLRFVVWSSYAIIGVALFGLGLVRYNVIAIAVATPIGFVLSYLWLRHYGIVGLAWAQVATALCTLGIQLIQARIGLRGSFRVADAAVTTTLL
jgi:O-antigen/teichoic acid export membrane protein